MGQERADVSRAVDGSFGSEPCRSTSAPRNGRKWRNLSAHHGLSEGPQSTSSGPPARVPSVRFSAIARCGEFTRKACGYGTIGVADRLRFPASRAISESEEIVKCRIAAPASAMTVIGADIEAGGATA
jgi:hypothetical protein